MKNCILFHPTFLLFLISGFVFTSCNDKSETEQETVAVYDLIIKNKSFEPSELRIPSGQKFKLRITNQDSQMEEFESHSLHREKIIPAGKTVNIVFAPLEKGVYDFFGEINPETTQGKIIVE